MPDWFDSERGDALRTRLLAGDTPQDDQLITELLHEFHLGYSVDNLNKLLRSSETHVVRAGVWIASELGRNACGVLADVLPLLQHADSQVRFFALDALSSCAEPGNAPQFVCALDRTDDSESSVRWKALMFLASLSELTVQALRTAAARERGLDVHVRGLDLLRGGRAEHRRRLLSRSASGDDAILHRYAAVAAARAATVDAEPLKQLMESQDETVRQFAADMLERLNLH